MNDISHLLNSPDGRQWLAMQYVLAELPDDQRQQFESVLSEDVTLCEAVVEACRLSAGVALAFESERTTVLLPECSSVTIARKPRWTSRFGVFSACASLAVILLLIAQTPLSDSVNSGLTSADDAAAADVLVGFLLDQRSLSLEGEADVEVAHDESLAALAVPEWLLTAVDLEEQESSGEDEPSKNDLNVY